MKSLSTLNTKLKLLAVLATANLCAITSSAQNFEWAYSFGASSTDCGFGIGIDPSGNVYTAGAFTGTVDFNPSAGTLNLTAVGAEDIYVSKADAAGNFLWAVNVGSTTYDNALALVVDATGSVYVTGLYGSTADFDPGVGTVNLTPVGADDAFILKLDNLGNFVWAKSIGSNSFESGRSIALDANNNVLITGDFAGTTDFDPGIDTAYLTAAGGYYDAFVLTLNNNGDFLWAKQFGGVHDQTGRSIAVDGSGNVYVGGTFRWTTDFDPGAAVYPVIGDDSTTADLYICKFDASGNFVWVKTIGGADPFDEINLSTDAAGNVVAAGMFSGSIDFDPNASTIYMISNSGSYDLFMLRLDASGIFQWVVTTGSTQTESIMSIDIDPTGYIFVTGVFNDTVDFNPGTGTTNLIANGLQDIFVCKYDFNGDLVWAKSIGGYSYDNSFGIAVDASENVYVVSQFYNTVDFDPGAGVFNLTSVGGTDVGVWKLNVTGVGIHESETSNVSLFPNPATTVLNIQTTEVIEHVFIYNSTGALVQTETRNSFSVAELSAGVYILQVQTASGISTSRFIKE